MSILTCKKCHRPFKTEADLDAHKASKHPGKGVTLRMTEEQNEVSRKAVEKVLDAISRSSVHVVGESGAKSSGHKPAYHLVPFEMFLGRLANRYEGPPGGAIVYGEDNWKKGLTDRAYAIDRANHTLEHLLLAIEEFKAGKVGSDDNLAAVIWGAIFLMGCQEAQGHVRVE